MTTKEINKIYEEVKSGYDNWLSPSEQQSLWAEFGVRVYAKTNKIKTIQLKN